ARGNDVDALRDCFVILSGAHAWIAVSTRDGYTRRDAPRRLRGRAQVRGGTRGPAAHLPPLRRSARAGRVLGSLRRGPRHSGREGDPYGRPAPLRALRLRAGRLRRRGGADAPPPSHLARGGGRDRRAAPPPGARLERDRDRGPVATGRGGARRRRRAARAWAPAAEDLSAPRAAQPSL